MSEKVKSLRPFISVVIVIFTFFSLVFLHMEVRRLGYTIYTLTKQERELRDLYRSKMVSLVKMTRPERVEQVAVSKLTLRKAEPGQVVQLSGQQIAIAQ